MKQTPLFLLCILLAALLVLVGCKSEPDTSEPNIVYVPNNIYTLSVLSGITIGSEASITYAEAAALHEQEPERYRDPGEEQPETQEMVRLEDGQWYQSYVDSSFNCRYIFLNNTEHDMRWSWDFVAIGSAKNAFRYNAGVRYEDSSAQELYVARSVAVRGTLSKGPEGYAYTLQLPDSLIVCVRTETGYKCEFLEIDSLAIPEAATPLLANVQGEVALIGLVARDSNGVVYLC